MIIELGNKTDKQGSNLVIKYANPVQNSPVVAFFMKNFAALIERGWSHQVTPPIHATTKAIYAELDDQVVGHIVFNILDDPFKTAWIVFSCVDENYRGRGIYNILHDGFENLARTQGSKKIASYVHVDNLPRQASCTSVGMKPFYYRMEKTI